MILKQNKTLKSILSILLIITLLLTNLNIVFADSNTIYINTKQELIDFSKNASLDTYYEGKTLVLMSDIEISNVKDFQIPTFSGVFDGNGYTISDLSISNKGSVQGLFRYLEKSGVVKDLKVTGKVTPAGSQDIVGGIVGKNYGTIKNCSFNGTVEGRDNIGGLVGVNEVSGVISNAMVRGMVAGDHYTGGIAGQNLGSILKSTNYAEVNTSLAESTVNIDSVNWAEINSTENIRAHTDTGGITGFSSGYIQDCINRGPIGYKHMGYNVGGITGRQSGYLNNCQNYNTVLGRKDIGGIVGQIEPYLMLVFSEDTLQKLNTELNTLEDLFSNSLHSAKGSSSEISSQFTSIGNSIDNTRDTMKTLSNETVNYADDIVDTVNITTDRIKYTIEEISPILESAEEISVFLEKGLDNIEYGFNNLELTSNQVSDALNQSQYALKDLREAAHNGQKAFANLEYALNDLLDVIDDGKNINQVLDRIDRALTDLENSFKDASTAIKQITKTLKDDIASDEDLIDPGFSVLPGLYDLSTALDSISNLPSQLSREIRIIVSGGVSEITRDIKYNLNDIFTSLEKSSKDLDKSIRNLQVTFAKLEDASDQSAKAFSDFKDGFNKFGDASNSMTKVTLSTKELVDSLVEKPDINLPNISSEFRQSGDDLFDNMDDISNQVSDMTSKMNNAKNDFSANIEDINKQISVIFSLLINAREGSSESEYIEDISTDNLEDASEGIVYNNQNYGSVGGAVNIGGIAGAIAVEFDLDPEDDIFKQGKRSLNFKYLTTAIVKNCINHGKISAKKDYAGGIAGRMDLGIISACENYGNIESIEGNYVGGVAGASYTTIDKSFSLSSLSGGSYVGGIAGYTNILSNSYSLIKIENAKEYIGAIAGKSDGEITNNYFVHDSLAAVDGISYSNKAAPISYDELLGVENLPDPFTNLQLSFMADGKIIKEIPFEYGDIFDLDNLPSIPYKSGHDSHWEIFNFANLTFNTLVEAVYEPLKTVISSSVVRTDGDQELPLLLLEGSFGKDVNLKLSPYTEDLDEFPGRFTQVLEAWDVQVENLESKDTPTIRLLKPDTKRKVLVWQDTKDGPIKVDSSIDGSYIVFPLEDKSARFYITQRGF